MGIGRLVMDLAIETAKLLHAFRHELAVLLTVIVLARISLAVCTRLQAKGQATSHAGTLLKVLKPARPAFRFACYVFLGIFVLFVAGTAIAYAGIVMPTIPRDLTDDNLTATLAPGTSVYKTFGHCDGCRGRIHPTPPADCSETTIVTTAPETLRARTIKINGHGIGCIHYQNESIDGWVSLVDSPIGMDEIRKTHGMI